jgi:sterol desaturase/sphingolipid hydroxylase (fatty acid hydroxylase superfamily)
VPKTKFGKQIRTHHMRHHFQDHRYGFGVSTPLWDAIMQTMPRRRKDASGGQAAESRSEARSA